MIKLLIDSSSDYPLQEAQQNNIEIVPISVSLDGNEIDINDYDSFYNTLTTSSSFPKTAQPSPQIFIDIFEKAKANNDELIYIALSSELSGTYQSANIAKQMVEYDKIYIIDSLNATLTIKIMIDYANELIKQNKTSLEIVEAVENMKNNVVCLAVLDTLEYLQRGGRLSKTAATVGELVNLKPVITLNKEGKVEVVNKSIGKIKAMNYILKHLDKKPIDESFPVYTIYSYGEENCEKFETKLEKNNINTQSRIQIGPVIGTHIGENAFGIIYVEK
jgi:DegV family protein with EDD domain